MIMETSGIYSCTGMPHAVLPLIGGLGIVPDSPSAAWPRQKKQRGRLPLMRLAAREIS
jgi:hypothetical protein